VCIHCLLFSSENKTEPLPQTLDKSNSLESQGNLPSESENPPNRGKKSKKGSTRPKGHKYTKSYKESMTLSNFLKEALIGLLGDVYGVRDKPTHNARLTFDQSEAEHSEYLLSLFSLFEPFVGTSPNSTDRKPDKRTGKVYNSLYFHTLAFPCFNPFVGLFYPNGVKVVPANIGELLTEVGLAFWIMDDGGYSHGNPTAPGSWLYS